MITITERFSGDQDRIDIWRRPSYSDGTPFRGPDNEPYPPNTNQSNNTPLLLFRVKADGIDSEVGIEFPNGRETSDGDLNLLLDRVRLSLEAAVL